MSCPLKKTCQSPARTKTKCVEPMSPCKPGNVDERIFFEKRKLAMADKRRGKDRPVSKLVRDYEYEMEAIKARERPTRLSTKKKKRAMGGTVEALVNRYESLRRKKEENKCKVERMKMKLAAERDEEIAEIEAQEAKMEKELHEQKQDHLTDKMEEVLEQELQAKLSSLAHKKEKIVEKEFEESVKEAEAKAEMENRVIEEKMQREEAARRKWYDMRAPVPAGFIYTPKNVQEKKADMDALVRHIGTTANPCKKSHPR